MYQISGRAASPKAGYRISGRILGLTTIFLSKILNKFIKKQLNINQISGRISGIRPYRISGRAIWYLAGYRISKKARLSGRISGASLIVNHAKEIREIISAKG
jgi:hypothetical protein